jgi:hypothetical protein
MKQPGLHRRRLTLRATGSGAFCFIARLSRDDNPHYVSRSITRSDAGKCPSRSFVLACSLLYWRGDGAGAMG